MDRDKPQATLEQQLVLTFNLPGVSSVSSLHSGTTRQLENARFDEQWTLRVNQNNVRSTIECLGEVIEALRAFERSRT